MIDLQKFCSTDKYRQSIRKPVVVGEKVFATNGHVMVRVDAGEYPGHENAEIGSSIAKAGKIIDNVVSETYPLPNVDLLDVPYVVECSKCNTVGEVECPTCGHDGFECDRCDGAGTLRQDVAVVFPWGAVQQEYFEMIACLPGARIARPDDNGDRRSPVYFTFDGGDGCVMPLAWYDDIEHKVIVSMADPES